MYSSLLATLYIILFNKATFLSSDSPKKSCTFYNFAITSEFRPTKREEVYNQVAQRLRELAKEAKTSITSTPPVPSTNSSHSPAVAPPSSSGPYILTVHLERRGPALDIRYYLPGMEAIAATAHPWQDALVARGDLEGALFALLFGTEIEWEPVFRRLFQRPAPQPRPNPIRAPVRLRICTVESLLLALPCGV